MSDAAEDSIHLACQQKRMDVVERLLPQCGPNMPSTARGLEGITPLHSCAWVGAVEIAEFLIQNGADVTLGDRSGSTPVCWAVNHGQPGMVRLLLRHGADVNGKEGAFLKACNMGKFDCVKVMCECGAPDYAGKNKNGRTGLEEARWLGNDDIVSYLQQYHYDADVFTHAYNEDHSLLAQELARNPASVTARSAGLTPLGWAVRCEALECVKELLRAGADPNAGAVDEGDGGLGCVDAGTTPVHEAISNIPILKCLIEAGGDPTVADARGNTPLHNAAGHWMDKTDCLGVLVSSPGVNLNKANGAGETALMLAVNAGQMSHVKTLLEGGADASIANSAGYLPVDEARLCRARDLYRDHAVEPEEKYAQIVELLEESSDKDIFFACFHNDTELLASCINDKSRTDRGGATPAVWCAYVGSAECLARLVEAGADLTTPTIKTTGRSGFAGGCTPVHCAAMHGHEECLRMLLDTGKIDLALKNECGCTALEEALDSFANNISKCISLLTAATKDPAVT